MKRLANVNASVNACIFRRKRWSKTHYLNLRLWNQLNNRLTVRNIREVNR